MVDHAARTALSYPCFAKRSSVDFAFDATYTLSAEDGRQVNNLSDLGDVASSFGPVVAMSFPLSDEIEFGATFRYCRSTDELPRFSDDVRKTEDSQHLDMRLAWHNLDPMLRDFDLSAGYSFDRMDTTEQDADTLTHALTVALAVNF